jgi:hypothetical protein
LPVKLKSHCSAGSTCYPEIPVKPPPGCVPKIRCQQNLIALDLLNQDIATRIIRINGEFGGNCREGGCQQESQTEKGKKGTGMSRE